MNIFRAKNIFTQRSGISMVEVIISIFILGMAATTATTMIVSALQTNRINKQKIIATNLAREGIEAVRNIRDSNWLRFSSNTDDCWNFLEDPINKNVTCDPTNPVRIENGYYVIQFGRSDVIANNIPYTYKWFLTKPTRQEPITNITGASMDDFQEYKLEYRLLTENQKVVAAFNGDALPTKVPYFRQIYIDTSNNEMNVKSTVLWFHKAMPKKVELEEPITFYQE